MKNIGKLSWIINNACNLRCVHCYPNSGIDNKVDFSNEEFSELTKNFQGMHFSRTFLSGGEPILDKNFYKYLDVAKQISDEVFLCSNGTLLTDELINDLVKSGIKGVILSLQALDEQTSYAIYGASNVSERVLSTIERIKKYDISLGVEITIMKQNILIIDEIIKLLISKNVKFISFKRLLPVGRACYGNTLISKEENFEVLNKIFHWQVEYSNIKFNVHDPLYGTIFYEYYKKYAQNDKILSWIKGFSCRAGTRWIGIDSLGNVSPCPILLYKDMIIGNVLKNPLIKILENSSIIKKFQAIEEGNTEYCKYGSLCLGCRATALSLKNDFYAKDPMCVYDDCQCPIVETKGDK